MKIFNGPMTANGKRFFRELIKLAVDRELSAGQ